VDGRELELVRAGQGHGAAGGIVVPQVFGQYLAQPVPQSGGLTAGRGVVTGAVIEQVEQAGVLVEGQRGEAHPTLGSQDGHGHLPALALSPDAAVRTHLGLVVEHLIELAVLADLADAPGLHAGLMHGHDEHGQPAVP